MCHCGPVSEQAGPADGQTGVWDHELEGAVCGSEKDNNNRTTTEVVNNKRKFSFTLFLARTHARRVGLCLDQTSKMVDRVDAEVEPRWLQLCANSTGFEDPEGAPGGSSEPRQKKVTRNRTTAPSRRKVQGIRKKRKKLEKRTAVVAGTGFEVNVQRAVQALVPFLRQTGVVRGDIAPQGKMARALAVAFSAELDDVHPADEGGGIRTSETTRILYGADRESVAKVLERLVAAGGSVAILALAALAPLGNRRPRGAASSKAECCRTALSDIASRGMKLRAAQLQLRDERLGQRAPSSAAPPQPLRPQPLRDVAVAAAAAALGLVLTF